MQPRLAIIIPTLNEQKNVPIIYSEIKSALMGESWELIFVDDDSNDGTIRSILEIATKDSRVRLVHRINRKGLSSACIEGMLCTCAPLLAVMDADLQHDVTLLPLMLKALNDDSLDIAVGSRYIQGGGTGAWHPLRIFFSRIATRISEIFVGKNISDPMSGFFIIRRTCFVKVAPSLSGRGFKILMDIITSDKNLSLKEFPYQFGKRAYGKSKLDTFVGIEFFLLIAEKLLGKLLPLKFLLFIFVGSCGAILHLTLLYLMLNYNYTFFISQTVSTISAMTINFFLNNSITHFSYRLKGISYLVGLIYFYTICGIGAFTNIQVASYLYELNVPWWGAGIIGAAISSVWNYAVTSTFIWKTHQ